jgi:hypothetical protein
MLYASGVRAIIDSTGLPEAVQYYRMFPRERSRTRALDFDVTRMDSLRRPTFLAVMDHMIAAAGNQEREVLIVAHGESRGFLMPVAQGGVSAMKEALRVIMNAATQIDRAAAIGALPEAQRVPAWRRFIEELSPGAIQGTITEQEAVAWFNQWKAAQAHTLNVRVPALEDLVNHMKQVRQAQFRRVEIRACNIGADRDAVTALKDFFGAACVCAPDVGTFYVGVRPRVSRNQRLEQAWMRRFGRPVRGGVYAGRTGPSPRNDTVFVVAPHDELAFAVENGFRILVWETSLRPHRYASNAFASEWSYVKAWVEQHIMVGSTYSRGNFVLAGMWTFGHGGQPFAAPMDLGYRSSIVCVH